MKNNFKSFLILTAAAFISYFSIYNSVEFKDEKLKFERIKSASSPKASIKMKKGRSEYFFNMLRDPATNKIPSAIRGKELEFVKKLNEKNSTLNKFSSSSINWQEAGPNDVGGRTRALAVDVTNPNTVIAGGISGGIWKSTNNGTTWVLKSSPATILSVTSIAQDPRTGFTQNWYYTTGEFDGNSARDRGGSANFYGHGVYKSTDNGETWQVLQSTLGSDINQWDGDFDFAFNIKVSPTTGSIFVAVAGSGIHRSVNGGTSFSNAIGGLNQHIYSDIDIASDGTILAILSRPFQGVTQTNSSGLYKSVNDGANWSNIPLSGYPSTSLRSVLDIAPSNPNVGYVLTQTGAMVNDKEEMKFYKINIGNNTSENRSNNIPNFSTQYPLTGYYDSQGNYNMVIAVKPDNENFVMIGGTNLFRSTDGFATKPNDVKTAWIGGYFPTQGYTLYPNFHSDVHSFSFDPTNPNKMWWGNDGGLSYTTDITNNSFPQFLPWESKNNGYNVTQFYHIAIRDNSNDSRIMGGTQDNGTPYFVFNGSVANQLEDVSSGDGSFSYFGQNFAYASSQNGNIVRLRYDQQNNPSFNNGWSQVSPTGATNQLFIHPFEIDPNNENVMYYPAGNALWRNNQLESIPDFQNGTSTGWTQLNNLTLPSGYFISALTVSKTPSNILYYGAGGFQIVPKVYKLANSVTATSGAVEISIPGAPSGAYVHNIAVNPDNANEILVVLSNYNITGLYHSTDGGQFYTAVEGNLEGTQQNPGPSLRSATILPGSGGKTYFLATSVGVFSTTQLNGNNTIWIQEAENTIGNVVVSHITSRKSDGRVVAGTHGRGAFVGNAGSSGAAQLNVNVNQLNIEVQPGLTRSKEFAISNPGGANLSFNINASGGEVNEKIIPYTNLPKPSLLIKNKAPENLKEKILSKVESRTNLSKNISPLTSNIFAGQEELILDDGNSSPAGFYGAGGTVYFYTSNNFQLDHDFVLEKAKFFMKTEGQNTNSMRIAVSSGDDILYDTTLNMGTSPSEGKWFEFQFPQYALGNLSFSNGQSFQIIVITLNTSLTFPAGYDDNALKPNNSYWAYYEPVFGYFTGWINLNSSVTNGAFLIRAVGNSGGAQNQNPVAVAQVSPNPAQVNQTVNFNGQGSYDNDGQINQYSWTFGDGNTSTQMNATHSYSQAGQYNYSLTVTDNLGASNQTSGQITVSNEPSRWTINPSSGNISPGGQQSIIVTYDASGLPEGNYTGQISITSNGGNTNIPVSILVSNSVDVDENPETVKSYSLKQNFPNPFNPSTTIQWSIPEGNNVKLKIYSIDGEEVATLVDEYKNAGAYETVFDAAKIFPRKSLSSGVYFYTLTAGKYNASKKLVLLK